MVGDAVTHLVSYFDTRNEDNVRARIIWTQIGNCFKILALAEALFDSPCHMIDGIQGLKVGY